MEAGMSHVAAQRGTKEIKVEKQNRNTATEAKLLHFVTFIFFLLLSIVSETEENCQRLPPNYSFFSNGSVRENECVILKQWLGILHVCTSKSSQKHLFPKGNI